MDAKRLRKDGDGLNAIEGAVKAAVSSAMEERSGLPLEHFTSDGFVALVYSAKGAAPYIVLNEKNVIDVHESVSMPVPLRNLRFLPLFSRHYVHSAKADDGQWFLGIGFELSSGQQLPPKQLFPGTEEVYLAIYGQGPLVVIVSPKTLKHGCNESPHDIARAIEEMLRYTFHDGDRPDHLSLRKCQDLRLNVPPPAYERKLIDRLEIDDLNKIGHAPVVILCDHGLEDGTLLHFRALGAVEELNGRAKSIYAVSCHGDRFQAKFRTRDQHRQFFSGSLGSQEEFWTTLFRSVQKHFGVALPNVFARAAEDRAPFEYANAQVCMDAADQEERKRRDPAKAGSVRVKVPVDTPPVQGHDQTLRKTVSRSRSRGFSVGGRVHSATIVSISVPFTRNDDDGDDDDDDDV